MSGSSRSVSELSLHFDYPVVFTERAFSPDNPALVEAIKRKEPARRHRVAVLAERAVIDAHPSLRADIHAWADANASAIELVAEPLVREGGEACKLSIQTPLEIAAELDQLRIDRQSIVVIAGGGAFLDMVGFAAAITHRGVRVVRIPTTVLSQADSGVGVKNGINAFGKKNFLGTFAPPYAVINDRALLSTLPARDRIAGTAEAVKVALIRDAQFFEWISANTAAIARGDTRELGELIERSAELHARHIATAGDPFELGTARPLDFGHWPAHKLEALTEYQMRHGEAVAIGIALDSFHSVEQNYLHPSILDEIAKRLEALGFRLWSEALDITRHDGSRALLEGIQEFREHLGGELTVTMLRDAGSGFETHRIDQAAILRGIEWLRARAR